MEEQLISLETAKLAKEKGFDVECLHFYCKNSTCNYLVIPYEYSFKVNANQETLRGGVIDNFGYGQTWSAPTQALLAKWLFVIHGYHICIGYDSWNEEKFDYSINQRGNPELQYDSAINTCGTSEEAWEEALVWCLKQIK